MEKIIRYCDRIEENLIRFEHKYASFEKDTMFQDACCMCIVQIGELVSQLSEDVKSQNPAIPWRIIKDTRNFYVHAYGSIDLSSVWNTLNEDIPKLKQLCKEIPR